MSEIVRVSTTRQVIVLATAGLLCLVGPFPLSARTDAGISGPVRVIDGDTIEVASERIRLEGIDAPETDQSCDDGKGGKWACGVAATEYLKALVARHDVHCEARGRDLYRRTLARCFAGGHDINDLLVREGFAWAFVKYSSTYVTAEKSARAALRGVWRGDNEPAWTFRSKRWASAEQAAPVGCAIKGNISRNSKLYHMPWSPYYSLVKISPERGERWFCSEADAIKAGWRPAGVN